MYKKGVGDFPYFVGIESLEQVATADDRICILNILGGEARTVTPISHAFSGGNVVFGTAPGRRGAVVKTPIGDIPVYDSVREGLNDGHKFNVGVVYVPPAGVRDGVAELIRVNPDLKKIVIITEKVSVHDAREIRAMAQANGIDIFGANCLGIADSWSHVRIGGPLGGDTPEETLLKGSIALYSNSGNFTTTMAQYLSTEGWGTTTLISSGKDVYIHFAAKEFAHAMGNDKRSKGAVMYIEPGGYYELGIKLTKPTVVCVVGRWKAGLTRAVGHAGAMSGGGDSAESKERWFMQAFGVDSVYTPENPVFSKQGAVVTNISHIPEALTKVMELNGVKPDFKPTGNLELKSWFGSNQKLDLPPELDLPIVEALEPYNEQIKELKKQVGAVIPRRPMKDCSGASVMDPKTQVTSVHGFPVLDLAQQPLEANMILPLLHEPAGPNDLALTNIAIMSEVNLEGTPLLAAAEAAREAGNAPNAVMAAACSIVGPKRVEDAMAGTKALVDLFAPSGLSDPMDESFDTSAVKMDAETQKLFVGKEKDAKAEAMLAAAKARGVKSAFLKYVQGLQGNPTADGVMAAMAATMAWTPLMRKRLTVTTVRTIPWYLRLYGVMIGASVGAAAHGKDTFCGVKVQEMLESWSLTDVAFLAITGKKPAKGEALPLQVLMGLLISNGPGSISGQGAKGAVAADGPQTPERVQINKGMIGFLTHSGFSHGGNGYEGMAFLMERFAKTNLKDPGDSEHGLNLQEMATEYAVEYKAEKSKIKELGGQVRAVPGINHPIFKGQPVNIDPREEFITNVLKERGEYNVFLEFYKAVVQAFFDKGVTRNVFCVNVDAVIAALLLKLLWKDYKEGRLGDGALETAAFTVFLYGRMMGSAAEIDDHLNRGRNMDTRTPASQCSYVS